jgi:hypothetical protein
MIDKLISSLSSAIDITFIPKVGLDYIFFALIYAFFLIALLVAIGIFQDICRLNFYAASFSSFFLGFNSTSTI